MRLAVLVCVVAPLVGACVRSGENTTDAPAAAIVGTPWVFVSLDGEPPPEGPDITLRFEPDGTLGGSDGCNRYRGSYELDGSDLSLAGPLAGTQMACDEAVMQRASAYTSALTRTARVSVQDDRLALHDESGTAIAVFEAQSRDLAGTAWRVIGYNNGQQAVVSILAGTEITLRFGEDGRVTGSAGCNGYFAGYELDGETVSFAAPAATRRFCEEPAGLMDQEARYLAALETATALRLEGDTLTLSTATGETAVTLVRAPAD